MKKDNTCFFCRWPMGFWAVALCLLIGITPSYALFGGKIENFSADNVQKTSDGKILNTCKLHVSPDAMRMDGIPFGGGKKMPKMNMSMLILKKQNRQFFYNHDKKLMFESPVDEENLKAGYKAMDNIESETVLGKETISGYKCIKKKVVTSVGMMGMSHKSTLLVWENDKFEIPLKTQDEEGNIMEMQNIKTGKPNKKLFKPLTGYKRVDNMMAVMGMDFGAMAMRDRSGDKEGTGAEPQQNMQEINVEEMMAKMQQAMGDHADPEQMAQMQQIMAQAMGHAKQTKQGKGAARELWRIIPQRPGDKIGHEMKVHNKIDVILGTQSTLRQVFDYYQKKLAAKGWSDGGTYIQNGQGTMSMSKGDQMVMFARADNPGIDGNYKLFYNVHYTGPEK